MAWMNQERKALLKAEIDKVIPADWKWTLSVRHHSTLVLTIRQAPVDLIGENIPAQSREQGRPQYIDINEFYIEREFADKKLVDTFKKIKAAMNVGNHDNSDPMTDYFDVGWYIDIKIGAFQSPFQFVPKKQSTKKQWARCATCKQATYVCAKRGCMTYDQLKAKVAEMEAIVARSGRAVR